jgi:hypothetical protein
LNRRKLRNPEHSAISVIGSSVPSMSRLARWTRAVHATCVGPGAEVLAEQPAQMSCVDAEPAGQNLDAVVIERPHKCGACPARRLFVNPIKPVRMVPPQDGSAGKGGTPPLLRPPRTGQLDIASACRMHRANRPAVNAGRADSREKATVIGLVAPDTSTFAFRSVEHDRLAGTESESGECNCPCQG